MHPPPFHLDHRLSDWLECRLEVHCAACGKSVYAPLALLRRQHGNRTFRGLLRALKCDRCRQPPAPVNLLAGEHRVHCYGAPPGWAIELVKEPGVPGS